MNKKSNEWPYDCPPDEALENLILAAGRAGISASGLVMNSMADSHMKEVRLWKGVVLSMLEGKKPPFKIGDKAEWTMGDKKRGEVTGVIYVANNRWYISIRGINEDYDDGERFTPNGGSPSLLYAEDWTLVSD